MSSFNQMWSSPRSSAVTTGSGYVAPTRRQVPTRGHGGPLRFVETLRGDGVLRWPSGKARVAYQLDLFEGRMGVTGSGTLDGKLPDFDGEAKLQLSDGAEVAVALVENDGKEAVFETRGAIKQKAPAKARRSAGS